MTKLPSLLSGVHSCLKDSSWYESTFFLTPETVERALLPISSLLESRRRDDLIKRCKTSQSCKLYNNKYMIGSTQIKNIEIFAFIAALVFKSLSPKFLF